MRWMGWAGAERAALRGAPGGPSRAGGSLRTARRAGGGGQRWPGAPCSARGPRRGAAFGVGAQKGAPTSSTFILPLLMLTRSVRMTSSRWSGVSCGNSERSSWRCGSLQRATATASSTSRRPWLKAATLCASGSGRAFGCPRLRARGRLCCGGGAQLLLEDLTDFLAQAGGVHGQPCERGRCLQGGLARVELSQRLLDLGGPLEGITASSGRGAMKESLFTARAAATMLGELERQAT